jgi:hypothetical protein
VNWYRYVYTERQVANEPADLVFLDDNQAIERQIVKLSFEFARQMPCCKRIWLSVGAFMPLGGAVTSTSRWH